MPILIDSKILNLKDVDPSLQDEKTVHGEIETKIFLKWKELNQKYFKKGEKNLTFVCPGIMSGSGVGNRGGSYPRMLIVRTANEGQKTVVWCDTAIPQVGGGYDCKPAKYVHDKKSMVKNADTDIEEILWLTLFDPMLNMPFTFPEFDNRGVKHPKAGKTIPSCYLLDRNDEAVDFLKDLSKNVSLIFYLTDPQSPIIRNKELILMLASAWGISNPEKKTDAIIRQELVKAVEDFEKKKNPEFGYDGFSSAVQDIINRGESRRVEIMSIIQRSIDNKSLQYIASKNRWTYMGDNGKTELKHLVMVPPSEYTRSKEVLYKHLDINHEDLDLLLDSLGMAPTLDKKIKKVYLPAELTEDYFNKSETDGGIPWGTVKVICSILKFDMTSKTTKKQIAPELIKYFITEKRTLPAENLLTEPE